MRFAIIVLTALMGVSAVEAQSLGEVARKARDRRQHESGAQRARTYSEEELKTLPPVQTNVGSAAVEQPDAPVTGQQHPSQNLGPEDSSDGVTYVFIQGPVIGPRPARPTLGADERFLRHSARIRVEPGSDPEEVRKSVWYVRMKLAREAMEDAKAWHQRLSTDPSAGFEPGTSVSRSPATLAADLEEARRDIESVEREIALIEDEARKQSIPPGWIR